MGGCETFRLFMSGWQNPAEGGPSPYFGCVIYFRQTGRWAPWGGPRREPPPSLNARPAPHTPTNILRLGARVARIKGGPFHIHSVGWWLWGHWKGLFRVCGIATPTSSWLALYTNGPYQEMHTVGLAVSKANILRLT